MPRKAQSKPQAGKSTTKGTKRSSTASGLRDGLITDAFTSRKSTATPSQKKAQNVRQTRQATTKQAEPQRVTKPRAQNPPKTEPGLALASHARTQAAKKPQPEAAVLRQQRQYLTSTTVDDEVFHVGDSAYVVMDPETFEDDEEGEPCGECGEHWKMAGRKAVPLIECDRCLAGFHLSCLTPPLPTVPEGDWVCNYCVEGRPPPLPQNAKPATAFGKFQAGELEIVRLESIWEEANGTVWYAGRWYTRPEGTHTGRQKHHGARELFLTQQVDNNETSSLLRCVTVCAPADLAQQEGDDIFVCEYEYDTIWQRFRRHTIEEVDEFDGDWAASGDDSSDEDRHDGNFKPIYAFWAEKGLIPTTNMRGKGRGRTGAPIPSGANLWRKHKAQGGDDWMLGMREHIVGLGASEIPAAARVLEGSPLCRARSVLALTASPRTLPCREAERENIVRFVEDVVSTGNNGLGQCLYVSGVPGTGKTATVLEVMRGLRRRAEIGELPPFQFAEINSLRLPSPQHAYTHLYEALTGQHVSPGIALTHLEELFSQGSKASSAKRVTVVLVDEVDLLVTRNQQVLYNLFEWPTRPGSKLAMIGVANTMDLPERLLPRIASRLGGRRAVFQPYNRDQLIKIVSTRLEEAGLTATFAANAINMACSKVAGVSGDVRRVLQLCRKAAEIAEEQGDTQVAMRHIHAAVEEMFSAAHMQLLGNACRLEKLLLAALLLETRARGRADAVLEDVAFRLQQLSEVRSEPRVAFGDCVAAAMRLRGKRLLLAQVGGNRVRMLLSLNVPHDDVVDVLHNDATIPWLKDVHL